MTVNLLLSYDYLKTKHAHTLFHLMRSRCTMHTHGRWCRVVFFFPLLCAANKNKHIQDEMRDTCYLPSINLSRNIVDTMLDFYEDKN